jgi:hypothetical protein
MEHRKFVEEELEQVRAESIKHHGNFCQALRVNTSLEDRVTDLENELKKEKEELKVC